MNRKKLNIKTHLRILLSLAISIWFVSSNQGQDEIAKGFFDQAVSEGYTLPIGIRFDDQNVGFVWEKAGKLYTLEPNSPDKNLILDISDEVGSWADHGFTGFTLDPEFEDNGHIYLAYTVDRYFLFNSEKSNYNPDSSILKNATIGRVARYTLDVNSLPYEVVSHSRKILIGETHLDGFPILADFHGVGSIDFGNDGSLFVGCGDGGLDNEPNVTYHTAQALKDGIIDSTMILGSYRAQSIFSMNGKLLRINPENGNGMVGNPYYDSGNPGSTKSRIWALGLRNPYKFFHIDDTGSHNPELGDPGYFVVGDVGSSYWEEFNLVTNKAQNFGWPVYEGHDQVWPYGWYEIPNPFAPNPLFDNSDCTKSKFIFQDLIKQDQVNKEINFYNPCANQSAKIPDTIPTYFNSRPFLFYNNQTWNPPTRTLIPDFDQDGQAIYKSIEESPLSIDSIFDGFSALPGDWHDEGILPDSFNHSIIVSDFSGWIKAFKMDDNFNLVEIIKIRSKIAGIVDLTINKNDNCIYYINIISNEVRKICHDGNPPPIAIAKADTLYGQGQLLVRFDASESYDPNMSPISFDWNLGDGNTSKEVVFQHLYTASGPEPQQFEAVLTVSDSLDAMDFDTINISLNNTPPKAKISSPIKDSKYSVNGYNRIDFDALVEDAEEKNEDLKYSWQIHLHHNSHFHSEEPVHKKSFSTLLEPIGCGEKDIYWYRINLKVKDSYGLEGSDETTIFPNCEDYKSVRWERHDATGNSILLNWTNEDISNLKYFIMQKISDAGEVKDIGKIENNGKTEYNFLDENPLNGENRYRLKIYTSELTYYYSSEKVALYPIHDAFLIYPNPSPSSGFNISLDQPYDEDLVLEIYSISGIKLMEYKFDGSNALSFKKYIDSDLTEPGVYVIKLTNGKHSFRRLIRIIH